MVDSCVRVVGWHSKRADQNDPPSLRKGTYGRMLRLVLLDQSYDDIVQGLYRVVADDRLKVGVAYAGIVR